MSKVAVRYAKSLFNLAAEKGLLDQLNADMKSIKHTCEECKDLENLLKSPVVKTDKKQAILKEIFSKHINAVTQAFLDIIVSKKRESYIPEISRSFTELYKKHKNVLTAVVTTAHGLDEELRKKVYEVIKKATNSEVEVVEKVNKEIIGGFIIRVGDKQDDTSIKTKLDKLSRVFKENPYVKEF